MNPIHKQHISDIKNKGDYCITKEGQAIMSCPDCGTVAVIENKVTETDPLNITGPFTFPCVLVSHAFYCIYGILHRAYDTIYQGDLPSSDRSIKQEEAKRNE